MQQQQQAEEVGLLGALVPGKRKLLGKTFYLDNVKKRPAALILETISLLGGVSGITQFSWQWLKKKESDIFSLVAKYTKWFLSTTEAKWK